MQLKSEKMKSENKCALGEKFSNFAFLNGTGLQMG